MTDQTTQEPTMEEILASIRRIISEDEPAEAPAADAAPEPEVEADPEPVAAAPEPEVQAEPAPVEDEPLELTQVYEEPAPEPAPVVETIGDIEATAAPEPFPAYEPEPEPEPAPAPAAPLATAVTASMAGGVTVEELVRSIVEPQVRTWLDQNLDGLLRDILRDKLNNVFR